jgi:phenylpropionate dioxygenase-like ring-hydroxylating dioxygenase large terminal subunit
MDIQNGANEAIGGMAQDLLPVLGFRNYWYPVTGSRSVGKKPVSVQLLGEEVVLFRTAGGNVAALTDRCPHRGTKLSRGRIIFPGTLSCGYHGWTFDQKGDCVATIVEGPDSKLPGKVRVKAYSTEERFGVIWLYMGEGEAPSLDEDLPPPLLQKNALPELIFWEWKCNWRYVVDNYADMCHAPFVHRTSLRMLFRTVAAWAKIHMEPLPDGKGLYLRAIPGGLQADYPTLGKFPASLWWRLIKGVRGPTPAAELRMPGYLVLKMTDPFFGVEHVNVGWPVPIDESKSLYVGFNITHPSLRVQKIPLKLWWHLYMRPLQLPFLGQDKRLVEAQSSRSERLSPIDAAVVHWRRFAPRIARQQRVAVKPETVEVGNVRTA